MSYKTPDQTATIFYLEEAAKQIEHAINNLKSGIAFHQEFASSNIDQATNKLALCSRRLHRDIEARANALKGE